MGFNIDIVSKTVFRVLPINSDFRHISRFFGSIFFRIYGTVWIFFYCQIRLKSKCSPHLLILCSLFLPQPLGIFKWHLSILALFQNFLLLNQIRIKISTYLICWFRAHCCSGTSGRPFKTIGPSNNSGNSATI